MSGSVPGCARPFTLYALRFTRCFAAMSAPGASLILTAVMPVALLLATGFALRKRGVVD